MAKVFDQRLLYDALDAQRVSRGLSWRQLCLDAGVAFVSTRRLGEPWPALPSVSSLVRMLTWLGAGFDLSPFLVEVEDDED